jgi:NAD(P)H-hydrate epimerase
VFLAGKQKDIKTNISMVNYIKLKNKNITIFDIESSNKLDQIISENNIIIDSMLGIGLSNILKEPYKSIVKKINDIKNKTVISIDVPTGFGTNTAIIPNFTLTFHDLKNKMDKKNCGIINIIDIGISKKAIKYVGPGEIKVYFPKSYKESHKGENGKVLVIGGGQYIGAPALTGLAALRTGSDLVYIVTPRKAERIISSFSPNLIVQGLNSDVLISENIPSIKKLISVCNSVIIGPGLGTSILTEKAIIKIIKILIKQKKPLVIDADAIKPIGKHLDILKQSLTIITPHVKEFKKLTGESLPKNINNRIKKVNFWAEKLGITIFLKSHIDILSDGSSYKLNLIHNEAMTVGGTGDVLAGIIGALLSKGVEPFNAIRISAFINGEAGNEVFKKKSYGLIATDIIDEIPYILNKYL